MRQWSFQTIEYFLKVARTLNFSQAAKELYISPQSLNKQILRFEEELGEPLFVRTTRHVELTLFGRYMQQMFEPVQEDYHRAVEGAERYLKRRQQTVRIAFFQAITKKEVVTPICNYLRAQERTVQIELFGGEIDDMIGWLYGDKCDLVITNIHDFEVWEDVEIIPFATAPAQAVVSCTIRGRRRRCSRRRICRIRRFCFWSGRRSWKGTAFTESSGCGSGSTPPISTLCWRICRWRTAMPSYRSCLRATTA